MNELNIVKALLKLTDIEIEKKEKKMINTMINVGAFPHTKGIEDFDFDFQPNINIQEINTFLTHKFIAKKTKSTIFTTNITFSNWDEIFKDKVLANAILDRILHHSHVIRITGKSYRLKKYYEDKEGEK